jgi:hypothetical protein
VTTTGKPNCRSPRSSSSVVDVVDRDHQVVGQLRAAREPHQIENLLDLVPDYASGVALGKLWVRFGNRQPGQVAAGG